MEISFLCKDRTSIDMTTNEGNECDSISFANKKVTTGRRKTRKKSAKSEIRFIGFAYNKQHIFSYNEDKCSTVGNYLLHCGIVHVRFPPDFKVNMVIFQAENLCNH